MIDRLYNIGVVPPWEQHRCIVPALIGAAAALGSSIYSNMRSRSNALEMLERQNKRQDYLSANAALLHRQAMSKAGLNINADIGYPTVAVPQGTPAQASAPDFASSLQALLGEMSLKQSAPKIAADARKTNADAKAQEIENERQETLDRHLDAYFRDKFPALANPTVQGKFKSYNRGTIDAQKLEREWESRVKELKTNDIKNAFDALVYDAKKTNSEVVEAMSTLPIYERDKLFNEVQNLIKNRSVMDSVIALNNANASLSDSQESLNRLEAEITRNSNIHELITKYLGEGGMADAAHFIVMLLGAVTGNMRFGANLSKFSGKTRNTNTSTNRNVNSSNNTSHVHVYRHDD